MGNAAKARLRFKGKIDEGEVLLETDELVFRGEQRLRIPFERIKAVTAKDGRLIVAWTDGDASFELGPLAEKWADRISNPKTVVQKLGIKPGQKVSVVHLQDSGFLRTLEALGAEVHQSRPARSSDAIFYGADRTDDLRRLGSLKDCLASRGALWIIRPKGVKEVTESDVLAAGRSVGLVDVKVVRFSETHTAEKFVVPVAARPK